jgi:hypothetical protein
MAKIYAPNENYNCDYGVDFINGVAIVDDANVFVIERLTNAGYTVVPDVNALSVFDYMDAEELARFATYLNVDITGLTKHEIVLAFHDASEDLDITNILTTVSDIDAGYFNAPTYADAAAIIAALPSTVNCETSKATIVVDVDWADTDTYTANVARSYTFTGTLNQGVNIDNPDNLNITIEAIVKPIDITGVETLVDINGGTLADPTYADAAAVIAVLPSTVDGTFGEDGTITCAVTWDDTDLYNVLTAGSYTFTGTLTMPANYTNTTNLTATIEVIIEDE